MNTKSLMFAVAAACIGLATPAFAQNYERDHRDDRKEQRHDARHDRKEQREDAREQRREIRQEVRQEVRHQHARQRGAGPRHDLYRGTRLPTAYHGERYVVRDYRRYQLNAPARGQQWVRAGNDYVLVALATGLIAQVLLK